ncbi:predicted protein [Arabidopsis lyrata subsp. lyrata]|uniref:Predicted protein n=1 Tax=Arabidopsis lyrata subsp. lyrata TaxID=81972 RepID=D7KBR9_ARALL|nr:predicted protein [Arabidopsis lyrata subsp. lyrata]
MRVRGTRGEIMARRGSHHSGKIMITFKFRGNGLQCKRCQIKRYSILKFFQSELQKTKDGYENCKGCKRKTQSSGSLSMEAHGLSCQWRKFQCPRSQTPLRHVRAALQLIHERSQIGTTRTNSNIMTTSDLLPRQTTIPRLEKEKATNLNPSTKNYTSHFHGEEEEIEPNTTRRLTQLPNLRFPVSRGHQNQNQAKRRESIIRQNETINQTKLTTVKEVRSLSAVSTKPQLQTNDSLLTRSEGRPPRTTF